MASIITITFNPAIDKSTTVAELVPDKKMKCSSPVFEPGGGGVNVARAIKRLGGEAKAIYLAGGYSGKFFTELLKKENIETEPINIKAHTRENLIVVDTSTNKQYRFGMPGPAVLEDEWIKLLDTIGKSQNPEYIVVSGSLPKTIPAEIFDQLSSITKNLVVGKAGKKAKLIVDTSGDALKHAIENGVYMIKPNLSELASLADKEWIDENEVESVARKIISTKKCEVIVISLGEKGAILITKKETLNVRAPRVERKSTVGAGDSMVAGIVLSLSKGQSLKEAIQYGVACGTAATMNPGTELCHKDDADKLYGQIIKSD